MLINELIAELIEVKEQGYNNNDPDDRGGESMYGITEEVARCSGYKGKMFNMPIGMAENIYKDIYWRKPRFNDISAISERVGFRLFDMGVVCGVVFASTALQRVLNVMNDRQKLYADIIPDGIIGPITLNALRGYYNRRSIDEMLKSLNNIQGNRFLEICERDHSQEKWYYGWIAKRID